MTMASRYQIIKDEEELVRMYRAGLLYMDYKGSLDGPSLWEVATISEQLLLREFRDASTGHYTFLPDEFAFLVEDDDEDGQ